MSTRSVTRIRLKDLTIAVFAGLFVLLGAAVASAAVPTSSINLSVETSATDLATIINQFLPKEMYKGQGAMGTSVTVLRTGPVLVAAKDNFIYFWLPVQLTSQYGMYESYPVKTQLRFKASMYVTKDWRLKTELYYTGLSDNLTDTLKLGPLSLNPKSMVEGVIQPVQKMLAPYIDDKVNEAVPLRAKVTPLWNSSFSPVLVSKEFSTWLRLTPEKIYMSPLSATNNQIRLSIGLITGAELTVGPKPAALPAKPLPPVQIYSTFDKNFHIQLVTDIFFADLMTALTPVLVDKTFGDDKKITVKSFGLKGEEDRMVVTLAATGDFTGELTLFAKPVYHPENNSLTFENVDFDTKNAGMLISAGGWLFSSTIRSTIKTKLDAAVVEQLEKARLKACAAMSSVRLADHVQLTGAVTSLSLGPATVLKDRLSIHVIAQGGSSVLLK
jgi:hypothetical protein